MYPSIFFSNNYQRNFDDYLIVKEFNLNSIYSNTTQHILTLQLPTTYFESELVVPTSYEYVNTDTYYEDNLSAVREDAFYKGINSTDQKYFYRVLDNDLATFNARALIEYSLPPSYILITYILEDKEYELYLPLPLKESIYNFYEDNQLVQCPFNISFSYEPQDLLQEVLISDNTVVTQSTPVDYNTAALNSLFTELVIDGLPSTNITLKLFINNLLITSTRTNNALVFYPKITYSSNITPLKELAYSLYSIKDFRPLDYPTLINALLTGLTHQIEEKEYYLPVSNLYNPLGSELLGLSTDCTFGLDVVFILDCSVGMTDEIAALRASIDDYTNKLLELTKGNYRTALVCNYTTSNNPPYRVFTTFSLNNKDELLIGYDNLGALASGAIAPEPYDTIINDVITETIDIGGWRLEANKLIILISDSSGDESGLIRNEELPTIAYEHNIRIVGLQVTTTHISLEEYFTSFTDSTYGRFLYSQTSKISDTLISMFDNLCSLDQAPIYVYLDNFDRYSYYDNCLIVLALLYNSSNTLSPSYQKYLDKVIYKLSNSLNLYTSYCNKETSLNLIPLIINDIPTTILLSLVLEKYLTYKYNTIYEYILYNINKELDIIIDDSYKLDSYINDLEDNDSIIELLYSLSIWLAARDNSLVLIRNKLTFLIESINPIEVSKESILKINYLIKIENLTLATEVKTLWDYSNHLTEFYPKVWGESEPSLYYSSWVNIIENNLPLWVSSSYRTNIDQAETFLANVFQKSLKYIPVNEPWFDPTKLDPNVGMIGLIMKASANMYLPLIFEYICYSTSLNIGDAYGYGLDKWGLFLDYPRELNEDDNSYKSKLKELLSINFINSTNLSNFIDNIKKSSGTLLETALPINIIYENSLYELVDVQDLYLKASENNPLSVVLVTGEEFILSEELGAAKIRSYETDEYNKMFLKLRKLLGIPVILKIIRSYELVNVSTVIYNN